MPADRDAGAEMRFQGVHGVTQGMSDAGVDFGDIPEPAGWEDPVTGLAGPDFWRRVLVAGARRVSCPCRRCLVGAAIGAA